MVVCCIPTCGNRSGRSDRPKKEKQVLLEHQLGRPLSFHSFPKNERLRNLWVRVVRRNNWEPTPNSRICSAHFPDDCYVGFESGRLVLKSKAVPSIINPSLDPARNRFYRVQRNSCNGSSTVKPEQLTLSEKLKAECFCAVLGCSNLKNSERDLRLRQNCSWRTNSSALKLKNEVKVKTEKNQVKTETKKEPSNNGADCSDSELYFYEFPKLEPIRQKWIEATGRTKYRFISKKTTICSEHFEKSCFVSVTRGGKVQLLKKDAIPTILPHKKNQKVGDLADADALVFELESTFDLKDTLQRNLGKIYNEKALSILGKRPVDKEALSKNPSEEMDANQFLRQISLGNIRISHTSSPGILKSALTNGNLTSNISQLQQALAPQVVIKPSSADISAKSQLTIKNDLKQPIVIVEAPGKLIVTPVKSTQQSILPSIPNSSCVQVNPNSCITVTSSQSKRKVPRPVKLVECTCPKDKFFIDGNKRIRVLTEREHKLRSRCLKNARLIKALHLSRNRGEEKVEVLKKTLKELRRDIDRRDRTGVASPAFLKFCREYLDQTKRPENPDAKYKYGKALKKFSMRLHGTSPEAYSYVREIFNKFLPHSSTVRQWNSKKKSQKESSSQNSNVDTEKEEERNEENYDSDWNADLESVTSVGSDVENEKSVEKALHAEIKAEIDCKLDSEGNILSETPFDLDDVSASDEESDSDFEMSFNTLCDVNSITELEINRVSSKSGSQFSKKEAQKAGKRSKDKFNTLIKVKSDVEPGITPGVVFETFAI